MLEWWYLISRQILEQKGENDTKTKEIVLRMMIEYVLNYIIKKYIQIYILYIYII